MMFKIEITRFENGNENSDFLTLPTDKSSLDNEKKKADIHGKPVLRICDSEKFPELVDIDFNENPTLDELNLLAEKLQKVAVSDIDTAAYRGLLFDGIHTIDDALTCAENVKTVAVYACGNFEEFGKLSMRDLLFGEFNDVPYKADGGVDYEKIGRLEHEKNSGRFIDGFYVITETYYADVTSDISEERNNITMGGIS